MRARVLAVLRSLAAAGLLAAAAAGQDCQKEGKTAFEVPARFRVDDGGFVRSDRPRTWEVLFWSKAVESENWGLDWTPCKRAVDKSLVAAAEAEHAALVQARTSWLAARREIDTVLKVEAPLAHVETTHFVVAWGISRITIDKKVQRDADAALIYALRLERAFERFREVTGAERHDFLYKKHHFYFFEKQRDAMAAGQRYTGISSTGTVRRTGGESFLSTVAGWHDKSLMPSDADFERHWIYNLTHQLTASYYNVSWFGPGEIGLTPLWLDDKYGWLGEGLAHWMEWDFDGKATNFSVREQGAGSAWKSPDWRRNVWRAVKAGNVPSFVEVATKPGPALSLAEHQFCYSWVDFLLRTKGTAMAKALKMAKMQRPTRDILREAFGLSLLTFEEEWAARVLTEYAASARSGGSSPTFIPPPPPGRGGG